MDLITSNFLSQLRAYMLEIIQPYEQNATKESKENRMDQSRYHNPIGTMRSPPKDNFSIEES